MMVLEPSRETNDILHGAFRDPIENIQLALTVSDNFNMSQAKLDKVGEFYNFSANILCTNFLVKYVLYILWKHQKRYFQIKAKLTQWEMYALIPGLGRVSLYLA